MFKLSPRNKCALIALLLGMLPTVAMGAEETAPTAEELDAWVEMGKRYYHGDGNIIAVDKEKSLEYFSLAAEHNVPEALYYLGTQYYQGEGMALPNEDKGEALYREAAKGGNPDAQMIMGVIHILEAASMNPRDPAAKLELEKAATFLKPAAETGHAEAQFWYGDMLVKGSGVEKDEARGITLIQQSAEAGNANGLAMLGVYYWLGTGLEKDPVKAYQYLLLSQRAGNENAEMVMARMLTPITEEQKKEAIAFADTWEIEHGNLGRDEAPGMAEKLMRQLQGR